MNFDVCVQTSFRPWQVEARDLRVFRQLKVLNGGVYLSTNRHGENGNEHQDKAFLFRDNL